MRVNRSALWAAATFVASITSFAACGGTDPCFDDPAACEDTSESPALAKVTPATAPTDEPKEVACAPCGADGDGKCAEGGGFLGNDGPKCLITSVINAKIAAGLVPAHDPPSNTDAQRMRDCVAECLKKENKGPKGKPCYSDPSPGSGGGMWSNHECMDAEGRCEDAQCSGPLTLFTEL